MEQERNAQDGAAHQDDVPEVLATVADEEASQEVMHLLSEHVPLALLADLALPDGPASPEILSEEGLPEVAWWDHEEGAEGDAETEPSEGATPTL